MTPHSVHSSQPLAVCLSAVGQFDQQSSRNLVIGRNDATFMHYNAISIWTLLSVVSDEAIMIITISDVTTGGGRGGVSRCVGSDGVRGGRRESEKDYVGVPDTPPLLTRSPPYDTLRGSCELVRKVAGSLLLLVFSLSTAFVFSFSSFFICFVSLFHHFFIFHSLAISPSAELFGK